MAKRNNTITGQVRKHLICGRITKEEYRDIVYWPAKLYLMQGDLFRHNPRRDRFIRNIYQGLVS